MSASRPTGTCRTGRAGTRASRPTGTGRTGRGGMQVVAAALAVLVLTAGCLQPRGGDDDAPGPFDGQAAWDWMDRTVYDGDELRPRHPEADGRDTAIAFLHDALDVPGWTVQRQDFTGADYQDAPKPNAVSYYVRSCPKEDADAVPGLQFTNLIATRTEAGASGHAVLAAHWDAKEDVHDADGPLPAANDGASGIGLILQMQRHLADVELGYDLSMVFFDGEDGFEDCHPLAGSVVYADSDLIDGVDRFILLDMVGDLDARFPRESRSAQSDPDLVDLVWSLAPEHELGEQFTSTSRGVVDDHLPLIEAGVPGIDIIDYDRPSGGFPPYWHTSKDTPDKLEPEMFRRMGELLTAVLLDPAFSEWPSR